MDSIETTRIIKVGMNLTMHPSCGVAGIPSGNVRVTGLFIVPAEDTECLAKAMEFSEMYTEGMGEDEAVSAHQSFMDEAWVRYEYTTLFEKGSEGETLVPYYFPISVFDDHTSCY